MEVLKLLDFIELNADYTYIYIYNTYYYTYVINNETNTKPR